MITDTPPDFRDTRAFLVDDAELAPEIAGADFHRVFRNCRKRVGRAKDIHDVHGDGHVEQALVALFPEDLLTRAGSPG